MQLFGQQKSGNLSGQKEIMQPLNTKKTMQPLGTKKSRNLSAKINKSRKHAVYWGKKSCNMSGQKNHANSGIKKSCNLLGEKIPLSIHPIASKLVRRAPNCSKWQ